jgi:hypothetical protein
MRRPSALRLALSVTAVLAAASLASAQPAPPQPAAPPAPGPAAPAGPPPDEAGPPPAASSAPAPEASLPGSDDESSAPAGPNLKAAPRRTLYTAAVIQVLDKVTAESLRFEAPLHKFIRYKGLIFLVNTCQSGQADQPSYAAHLEVDSQPPALPGRPPNPVKLVFRGWMFTDAPGSHPFEHPVYDTWLIACKTVSVGE